MTRAISEPYRRHVGGVTWTRDDLGRYTAREGAFIFVLYPVRSGRGGRSGQTSYSLYINSEPVGGSWPLPRLRRCLEEAGKLVRKEQLKDIPHPDAPVYHEHVKLKAVSEESNKIGEFIDWLNSERVFLCSPLNAGPHKCEFVLIGDSTEQVLARYFNIDLRKIETEKRAMLEAQRALNAKRRL